MSFNYPNLDLSISLHDEIIKETGGLIGIKDLGQLESILAHIENDDYYPTFYDKLTHLVFCIIKFHCFNDGNKRTSIALSLYFLMLNNYNFKLEDLNFYIPKMEQIVLDVADNKLSKKNLKSKLVNILSNL